MSQSRPEPVLRAIPVSDLLLDPDNPRFFHLKTLHGRGQLTQEDLMKEMEEDSALPTLIKAIKQSGVTDPIWVKQLESGKFVVLEGNRRTFILRKLLEEKEKPPSGVRYDEVRAHVYGSDAPETELVIQKARLQAGKKEWGPFNEAAYTYELRYTHHMEEEDIATELQKSIKEIQHRIEAFKMFKKYADSTRDRNPKKFAMFHDAPPKVWSWFNESAQNLKDYYNLISPTNGTQKIRSVATRGGLRDFEKILDDKEALRSLLKKPDVTVEDALEIAKNHSIKMDMPFITKIGSMANNLNSLDEDQVDRISKNKQIQLDIKRLEKACQNLLVKLGVGK
jgi:hypothetical protein